MARLPAPHEDHSRASSTADRPTPYARALRKSTTPGGVVMHELVPTLLPHLARAAREARVAAGLTYAHVAVHVVKRDGREGVSGSTVARFEYGRTWPENPDAMIRGYQLALGLDRPCSIWQAAIEACAAAHAAKPKRGRPRKTATDGKVVVS